jgi:hypothetical protein
VKNLGKRLRLLTLTVVVGLALVFQGGVERGVFAEGGGQTCTVMVYLSSFRVIGQGTRVAGNNWVLVAEVNGSQIASWHYTEGFSQKPLISTLNSPLSQLKIRVIARDEDGYPDIDTAEGSIELKCPLTEGPVTSQLEVTVIEDRGPQGKVPSWFTRWRFELLVLPLLVQYH